MSEFKVGQRVRIVDAFGSMFLRTGDIGTVVAIDSDGDVWAMWENPLQKSHDNVWCSMPSRLEIIDEDKERLIAAAPELLSALESLVRQEDWHGEDVPAESPIGRAMAAIAKATGE